MPEAVIVGFARTPFARFMGPFKDLSAAALGAYAIKGALEHAGLDNCAVDYLIMGMVLQGGAGQIPSRQAAFQAGLPFSVPSETLNKVCASGLRAVNTATMMIQTGEAKVVVAGGMENMSAAPYYLPWARGGGRMGSLAAVDGMIKDGLWCPFHDVHMGVHGSAVPKEHGIDREQMDIFALKSHQKAVTAAASGFFEKEIVAVETVDLKGKKVQLQADELPRPESSLEKLAKLPPAFEPGGLITAGNAPPISDGACALVLAEKETAKRLGLKPLARLVAQACFSLEPRYIATVPYEAARLALEKAHLKTADLKLIEVNEAFAAVALTSIKLGRWDESIVNVNGGALALGHPIGASGARILVGLVAELKRRGGGFGLATICSGAAQGEATIVEVD